MASAKPSGGASPLVETCCINLLILRTVLAERRYAAGPDTGHSNRKAAAFTRNATGPPFRVIPGPSEARSPESRPTAAQVIASIFNSLTIGCYEFRARGLWPAP